MSAAAVELTNTTSPTTNNNNSSSDSTSNHHHLHPSITRDSSTGNCPPFPNLAAAVTVAIIEISY